ncbi:MAG: alpha/beta hydrolase [Gemmataceae bacterium]
MQRMMLCVLALMLTASLQGAEPKPLPIWPKGAPGEKGDIGEEKILPDKGDKTIRVTNVTNPTLSVYPAPKDKNTGTAVVICPGGGYTILAWNKEGTEIAEWLNTIGVTGIVLKYRVPRRSGDHYTPPLQDVQRAIGIVRKNAKEWGIDPGRIGVLGFSAGGHLAANVSNNYDKRAYEAVDDADKESCRPDFAVLVYAGGLVERENKTKLSPEMKVTEKTPPTLLIHTQDDGVPVEGCLFYYLALKSAKVPSELHVYPSGGHGYGLRPSKHAVSTWPQRAERWFESLGLLTPAGK